MNMKMVDAGSSHAIAVVFLLCAGTGIAETRLCGYEPEDETVAITSIDTTAAVSIVAGGVGGAPYPTEGEHLLKVFPLLLRWRDLRTITPGIVVRW